MSQILLFLIVWSLTVRRAVILSWN